jgi:hypothetical protein
VRRQRLLGERDGVAFRIDDGKLIDDQPQADDLASEFVLQPRTKRAVVTGDQFVESLLRTFRAGLELDDPLGDQ